MRAVLFDVFQAFRTLRRAPGYAVVAILTLAAAIGGVTAVFSVVEAALLRPLPYAGGERLVSVASTHSGAARVPQSMPDWRERRALPLWDGLFAYAAGDVNVVFPDGPVGVSTIWATADVFPVLGLAPAVGHAFDAGAESWGNHRVVLLGDRIWRERFSASPDVVGRTVKIDGDVYEIAAVMPAGFAFPGLPADMLAPLALDPALDLDNRSNNFLSAIGRLARGVSLEQARAALAANATRIARDFPQNAGLGAAATPLRDTLVGNVRGSLILLLGAIALVLLVACANLANLALARGTARRRELALRGALGAPRHRLISQLLWESIILALAGGALGLLVAAWGADLLAALAGDKLPDVVPHLNLTVLAFAAGASMATGVAFGILPALRATQVELQETLSAAAPSLAGGGVRRAQAALVVAQVALSVVLVAGAALFGKSFARLSSVELGFDPARTVTGGIALPAQRYPGGAEVTRFTDAVLERVRAIPGVEAASMTTMVPLGGENWGRRMSIEGGPRATRMADVSRVFFRAVSDGHFGAMRAPMVAGRDFSGADRAGRPLVTIVNQAFVRRYFGDGEALGRRIWMGPPEELLPEPREMPRLTIVGVVADLRTGGVAGDMAAATEPEVFVPIAQQIDRVGDVSLIVRGAIPPAGIARELRKAIAAVDPEQPIVRVRAMDDLVSGALARPRLGAFLLIGFAGVALFLAALGIYGVLAYTMARRVREIGIRRALGARDGDVVRMVVRDGLKLAFAGILAGTAAALGLSRLMVGLVYGVSPTDPVTLVAAAVALGLVAALASWLPARRAARVEPVTALRSE